MTALVDLIFIPSEVHERDLVRLAGVLAGGVPLQHLWFVGADPSAVDGLSRLLPKGGPALEVVAEGGTAGLNRALLLCTHDVLIAAPGVVPEAGCVGALAQAARAHDRIAAVTPVARFDEQPLPAALTVGGAGIPEILEVPAPDTSCLLLRGDLLRMIGALDPLFGKPHDALSDWCLRAQRLGFLTVRAQRAWVRVDAGQHISLSHDQQLARRHPSYEAQRSRAESNIAARLPHQALSLERGTLSMCLDVRYLPEDAINGTGLYAVELGRALGAHTPARVSWLVLTEGQERALTRQGFTVYREGSATPTFDLVHRPAQVFRPRDLPWLLDAQAPFVITYQDLIAYRACSAFARFEDHEDYRLASHLALRSAQAVIAISAHNRGEILREFHLADEDVSVVHHGVDAQRFAERDLARNRGLLSSLGVQGDFFFSVGSDYAHKNLRLVLASYTTFRARFAGPGATPRLVIAGHPSGTLDGIFPWLRLQSPPGVVYLGDVSDEALTALYQESVALLYLSAYEGFGLPLLEAMAARTPALCSRFSSIPEVAGDAALYADEMTDLAVARQMSELAKREELRHSIVELGAARVQTFTWAETARKSFAVYERALRSPSSRSLHERRASATVAGRLFR